MMREEAQDAEANAEAQSWLEERLRGLSTDDFEEGLCIFCTADLRAPEAFRTVWRVISEESVLMNGAALLSAEVAAGLHTILVFCNQNSTSEIHRLSGIITNIDASGIDAPPMFWVPHSAAPQHRGQDSSDLVPQELVTDLLQKGLDGIIFGEPQGMRLSLAVRSRIIKAARLSQTLTATLEQTRERERYAQFLQHRTHATLWDYVRPRIAPELPPTDDDVEPGEPPELPGYRVGNKLGGGTFGAVYKLTQMPPLGNGVQVVRVLSTEDLTEIRDLEYLNRMISLMRMVSSEEHRHPNIVRLYQTYRTPASILLRMEYGGPENLYRRLRDRQARQTSKQRPLPLDRAAMIVTQAVEAVWHLHAAVRVCHRNIKPEKVIVNETPETVTIKLADFDLAEVIDAEGSLCNKPCGTMPFAAPEMLNDEPYDGRAADIWSLGVVLAEVLCGLRVVELAIEGAGPEARPGGVTTPLGESVRAFFQRPGAVAELLGERCLPELRPQLDLWSAMLAGMLAVDPGTRAEAGEVRSVLQHGLLEQPAAPASPARL